MNFRFKATEELLIKRLIILNDKIYNAEKGCPQGGKASPTLWKIGLNDLLIRMRNLDGTVSCAFADDLSGLIYSNNKNDLQIQLNKMLKLVEKWCAEAEVKLNVDKMKL